MSMPDWLPPGHRRLLNDSCYAKLEPHLPYDRGHCFAFASIAAHCARKLGVRHRRVTGTWRDENFVHAWVVLEDGSIWHSPQPGIVELLAEPVEERQDAAA
jgi:hypothetical protein